MTYKKFIEKAIDELIYVDQRTGLWFIDPDYKYRMHELNLNITDIQDFDGFTIDDLKQCLQLQILINNTNQNKAFDVAKWLHQIITQKVDPVVLQEQTQYIKSLIEYRNQKQVIEWKTEQLQRKQQNLSKKQNFQTLFPGLNFKKRDI